MLEQRKRKVTLPDGEHDAVEIGFRTEGEYFNEYLLDDGTVIRVKSVMMGVMRVEDAYDGDGNPVYAVKSNNVVVVSAPDDLRKDGGK